MSSNFENKSKDNLLPLENNRHQNHQPVSKTSGKKLSKPKSGTSKHDDELDNLLAGTLSMQPKSQYSKPAATDNDSTQLKTKVKQLQRQIDVKNKMIIVKDDQIKQLKKKYDDAMNLNHRLQLQVIDGQRSAVGNKNFHE
ncbi:uncharacterized protein LOC123270118 [Cotesia glomerata]|uniref:uncharacterized protein LOC123270118 n=1 Tax=Cotesia glomerata TaxID=32391 RepID=UPI001D01D3C8|nr:uncharacterized protein LOC123270118 [Cotesia glomerata]